MRCMWQCYNTESYSAETQSIDFHHVRSVPVHDATMSNAVVDFPRAMIGHSGVHRIFVLGTTNDNRSIINRIDPVNGNVELSWVVDRVSRTVNVAADRSLLVTLYDRVEEYSTDGNLLRLIIPPSGIIGMKASSLHPDGTITDHYTDSSAITILHY